jgi:hypothetical protein
MKSELYQQLQSYLAESDSEQRKFWASRIVNDRVPIDSLFTLFHGEHKTAQRFMWLLGDVSELDSSRIMPYMSLLFSMRDQMPFPGMPRSVAKWLIQTNVPEEIEDEAIKQLFEWLGNPQTSIACKSFSAKCLGLMVKQGRASKAKLVPMLKGQFKNSNRAFVKRMKKLHDQFELR